MSARRFVRSAGGAALTTFVLAVSGASPALAAPTIVNTGTAPSGNASFQETGAIEQDGGGNRRVDATFVINVDPGRTISQVVGDGISASFSQESAGANTRVVHATFNVTSFPGVSCGPFNFTRRNTKSVGWRVVDSSGQSSGTVTQSLKVIEDDGCTGATDFPVLETSDHTSNSNIAPGGAFPFGFRCDDADSTGGGDRCDFVIARWRRLSDGTTQSEGNFDAEDNVDRNYTASAPTSRGVWVLEAQLSTEDGVDDSDWWRLGRVRVNPPGFNPGSIAFSGANPSSPPSVNQGTSVTAQLSGYSGDAQLVNWSGTTTTGLDFNGNPFLSGGNLVNPALTAAETQRGVSTSTHGTKTVSATVTDSGAIDAADGSRDSATASAELYVNALPTANGRSASVDEDTPESITLTGTDPDNQPLTPLNFSVGTQPAKGTVAISGSTATYTPHANATGADSFTFTVADGPASGNRAFAVSAPATVTVAITPVNDAPVAEDLALTTSEDTAKEFELQGSDVDNASLTYTITNQPDHGTVSCTGKDCTYTPQANFFGSDALEYQVSDGSLTDTATVSITVNEGNDAPTAADQSETTAEDTAAEIALDVEDADGDALTVITTDGPEHGTVSYAGTTATYTPAANFHGADAFTYEASDGKGGTVTATVSVTVTPVNDVPTAGSASLSTAEDTPLQLQLAGSDVDGDPLTFAVEDEPEHGAIVCDGSGACTYTPAANFHGSDSFTYRASDGSAQSAEATVDIVVTPVNDAPVGQDASAATDEDTAVDVEIVAADVDDTELTYGPGATAPSHGSVAFDGATVTYAPAPNFHGHDEFTVLISDGELTDEVTVSIDVVSVNDAPVANGLMVSTDEDTALEIQLAGSDVDGDALAFEVADQPQHGSVSCNAAGACTYTPAANFHGSDSFTYTAHDGTASSSEATVEIVVNPVNDAPVGEDASATTDEDTAVDVEIQATDADGTSLSYGPGATAPAHGSLSFDGATVTYAPAPNFHGHDEFTVLISDGELTDEVTVSITVTPVNDAPVADGLMVSTDEDTALDVQLAGSDVDGDPLTFAVEDEPEHGAVSCDAAGDCTYTPAANFHGTDSFTYRASDGTTSSAPAVVDIIVNPVNDAPVGEDASATTDEDTPVDVALQATDVDDTELTFGPGSTAPSKGSIAFDGATVTYTPDANANGDDAFTVVVSDGELTDEMTVSVTIRAVNDAPVAHAQMVSVDEDGLLLIELDGADVDGDPITFQAPSDTDHGQLQCNASGACAYSPDDDFFGSDGFTFTVSDGTLTSTPAQVDIVVNPVNDAPDVRDETVTTDEDEAIDVALDVTDVDDTDVALSIGQQPQHGTVTLDGTTATYTPAPNFHGQDQFTVVGSDGELTDEGTVKVTVRPVNDVPTTDGLMVSTDEDTPLGIQLEGDDLDGDDLTFAVDDEPQHGTVDCDDDGACTYTPAANFFGSDSFTYRASDGTSQSAEATVEIVVNAVNDAPVGQDASATTPEDTAVDVELEATDVDDTSLTYGPGSTAPSKGAIAFDGSTVTYTPDADANGDDAFTVLISDGELTDEVTVSISITPVNDPPVAQDADLTTDEDTPADVTVQATDVDGDDLSFSVTDGPAHGTLTCDGAVCTYTPAANHHGDDEATVTVTDGNGGSDTATVSITVRPVNDEPNAEDQAATTAEDTPVDIELDVADVDGDTLTPAVTTDAEHGTVSFDGTTATYTPDADFHGDDSFTYEVSDGHGGTASATVSITVTAVNDGPSLEDVTASTAEDTSTSIAIPAQDADGDALVLTATAPEHGTVTCSDGSCLYTPAADFHGTDTFDVTATDPSGASATATVTVTVAPVNDAPVAEDLSLGTEEDTQLDFSLQASDVDGDPLTYTTTQPAHGTVSCLAQSCHYQPAQDYNGPDQFTYTVTDGAGGSDTATVTIDVGEVSYPTRVVAEPMVFITQKQNGTLLGSLGIQVRLLKVRARLTRADTGAPQAGETLVFRSGSTELCRATTGADGWATCTAPLLSFPVTLLTGGYTASFAGDPDLHASQGSAPTIGL